MPLQVQSPIITQSRSLRYTVLFIALLAGFITPFDGSAVNIALPSISAEFHMDAVSLSWISTAYLLAAAIFLVPFGRIADIYGRKRIFLYGIVVFTLASFLVTMVPTTTLLILARTLQGFGGALIYGTSIAILTSVFPPGERGKALGIYVTAVFVGLMAGPLLGGLLTDYFGWRSIFFVNIPLGIIACLLIVTKLDDEWAECAGESFDFTGSVLYALSLIALMYGFSEVPGMTGLVLIPAGLILGAVFLWYETRTPSPVLDMHFFTTNRVFTFSNLAALINYSATYAVTFLLSLDLQYTKGFSPEYTGLVLIIQPAVMALVSPIAGRLSDRIDPQIVASAGMGLGAIGLFLLSFLSVSTPLSYIIICLIIFGAGLGLFSSPNINAIMSAVEKRHYG
ncbi:MAG TPA: MFS transporter, partial [Methanoregula sp.]|nr:MFS transporter [Methanoregula sp.]